MCSRHVEAWNKLIVKQKFYASSWLIWYDFIFKKFCGRVYGILFIKPKAKVGDIKISYKQEGWGEGVWGFVRRILGHGTACFHERGKISWVDEIRLSSARGRCFLEWINCDMNLRNFETCHVYLKILQVTSLNPVCHELITHLTV